MFRDDDSQCYGTCFQTFAPMGCLNQPKVCPISLIRVGFGQRVPLAQSSKVSPHTIGALSTRGLARRARGTSDVGDARVDFLRDAAADRFGGDLDGVADGARAGASVSLDHHLGEPEKRGAAVLLVI